MSNPVTSSKRPKKVMIMTVSFGGGHIAMGRNLSDVIRAADPSIEIKTIDAIRAAWPSFSDATSKVYAGSTSHNNALWFRIYYRLTDRFPQPLRWFAEIAFARFARKKYQEENPDLIITTFPFIADVAVKARDYNHGTAPVITTITDAGNVQGIWLSKRADMTLTATPDTVPYLIKRGLDADKVAYVGFPAAKQFYSPSPAVTVRNKLGLKQDVFTILLTAGGAGLNSHKVLEVAKSISTLRLPYQIVLNAGSNDKLKDAFEKITFPYAEKVIVEGYTDKMPDYICASDVICCKSGWLTINEALVLQRALILYDAVPGHEEQNVQYVTKNHFGVYEPEPQKVASQIRTLMTDPSAFVAYKSNMKRAKTDTNPYEQLGSLILSYLIKQR